mmetsp:Transcript_76103/g.191574  ORF Transcript_76103/g.191574 Transcript_76103/m.191574 type:complete len:174 (-) Transcript_76103:140-661(-)
MNPASGCRLSTLFSQYLQQTRAQNSFSSFISKRLQLVKVEDNVRRSTFQIPLHQSDCHAFAMPREGQHVHGGVITTVVEDATTMHICANDSRSRKAVSTDLNMSFVGVGKVGRTLQVDSSILKIGGVLGVAEAHVKDANSGKLIAVGRHTMMFIGEDNSATEFAASLNSVFDV